MSRRFPEMSRLKAEIVARVAAGASLREVCADPALPQPWAVSQWARKDAGFRAGLDDAMRRGAWARTYAFDEARAEALLARMRAGETLARLWADPAMPGRRTYIYWRRTQPVFGEALWRIRQAQRQRLAQHGRDGLRAFDPVLADRIAARLHADGSLTCVLAADPGAPCAATVGRWRREQPDFDLAITAAMRGWRRRKARGRHGCTPELTAEIAARIVSGASLLALGREPRMPSATTLHRWVTTRPDFAREIAQARAAWAEWRGDQLAADAEAALARGDSGAARRALRALDQRLARARRRAEARDEAQR